MKRRALLASVRPTARAITWTPVAAGCAAALAVVVSAFRHANPPGAAASLRMAAAALAIAAGFAFDDPAADTLAATPVPRRRRRAVRAALVLAPIALTWTAINVLAVVRADALPHAELTLEAVSLTAVAMAIASFACTAIGNQMGGAAAGPGVVVSLVVAVLLPKRIAVLGDGTGLWHATHLRLVGVAVVAVLAGIAAARDPAARRWLRRASKPRRSTVAPVAVPAGSHSTR